MISTSNWYNFMPRGGMKPRFILNYFTPALHRTQCGASVASPAEAKQPHIQYLW
jgi:hypothetical protein